MLIKVEIENFMSHQKTVFEFVPGTNVIIGESDKGKSAAFSAINWVVNNRPLGDSFRSVWGGDTRVALHTAEGNTVERIRSDNKNEYRINREILEAFGTQVPQEVSNILQLDGFNIQAQMDPDFLLSQTPGEAARILNKAAAIDEIDTTVSGISKALYQINSGIRYKEKQVKEYEQETNQYRNLPEIETKIQQAEELEILKQNQNRKLTELRGILFRIQRVEFTLERTKHLPKVIDMVIKVELGLQTYKEINNQYIGLERIIAKTNRIYSIMEEKQREIEALKKEQEKIPLDICPLCGGAMGGKKHEKSETETPNIYQG